jgi:hypothetical protein
MKKSTWNILTILVLIGTCLVGLLVVQIYSNPTTVFNPFPPQAIPPTVVIPTSTPTLQSLPPTWTPTQPLQLQDAGLRSSSTPVPTLTVYVPPRTATNTPTLTMTASLTPLITDTPGIYDCTLTNQLPANGTNFSPGAEFFATWTIENIGWYSLDADEVDFRYRSGTHLEKQKNAYDLPHTLMRSGSENLAVPMVAPTAPGSYAATWAVTSGKQVLCSWTIQVNVSVSTETPPG